MFQVLKPRYERTSEILYRGDGSQIPIERVAEWQVLGQATSMADAKARFGGYPVLQAAPARQAVSL